MTIRNIVLIGKSNPAPTNIPMSTFSSQQRKIEALLHDLLDTLHEF